ncbi:DUF2170 family protein [Microbulbifer halophilus]|uniref:DUF2170 family protein n=1 Tax=Microbulbifer halophilus TaxID=453963 RepID=A0ABW5EAQ4_9GAMM|nr:DUF2170 family protein [Microbulbifer halophilus]MCW8127130.1 DUF2170 family protein [Microbulbifer halophilus]
MTWNNENLRQLAQQHPDWVVEAEGDCLSVSNDEGVDAFVYVGEEQIVVETILFPVDRVDDEAALNKLILQTHQLVPLTTIAIKNIGAESYYVAFGALSVSSKDEVVIEEIETLFANVGDFLDLYAEHFEMEGVA